MRFIHVSVTNNYTHCSTILKNADTDQKKVHISLFYLIVLSAKLQFTEHISVISYLSCTLYIYIYIVGYRRVE
jgi:hypothetical protein